ncbi:murein hydrolase activator EnvC family protein [Paenibacillus pinistramenti]|uniref:murein hydrolase activator EnvC family protein n=1 Tax=Paenibacillus pinistramenti TaxID=1768003 RepID=UPI0011086F0E|nr:hypothetical protein [Paenibacillus pinistramenti]
MRQTLRLLVTAAWFAASVLAPGTLLADPNPDDTHQVLENSLSIIEIDREIAKIEQQQQDLEHSIAANQSSLSAKEKEIGTSREAAGERIRAYYMGEREDLLAALLSVKSFRDFLTAYDYISLIFEQDQKVIREYKQAYAALEQNEQELEQLSDQLKQTKSDLLAQRDRVEALQEDVDQSIADSEDPEQLKEMIDQLGSYWNNVGLEEVRKYFKALDGAMRDFPDFLEQNGASLVTNGLNYTLTIKEKELNAFLLSKNELFKNFAFHFEKNQVTAEGKEGELELRVEGHYSVENEPENAIIFHVDKLVFNGFTLPDTTARDLEEQFDLGFYPQEMMPFIKAESVELKDQQMIVKLKLAL